jgi:hypothetical protein
MHLLLARNDFRVDHEEEPQGKLVAMRLLAAISCAQKRAPVVIDRGFGQERADFI